MLQLLMSESYLDHMESLHGTQADTRTLQRVSEAGPAVPHVCSAKSPVRSWKLYVAKHYRYRFYKVWFGWLFL